MSGKKLNLDKFSIAKLTGSKNIIGGDIPIDTNGNNNTEPCYHTDSDYPGCPQTTVTAPPTNPKCITSVIPFDND